MIVVFPLSGVLRARRRTGCRFDEGRAWNLRENPACEGNACSRELFLVQVCSLLSSPCTHTALYGLIDFSVKAAFFENFQRSPKQPNLDMHRRRGGIGLIEMFLKKPKTTLAVMIPFMVETGKIHEWKEGAFVKGCANNVGCSDQFASLAEIQP